ncbi:MAG: HD domain-containing protein [Methanocorpusculum sp.]|nr:HD domain-containing protein [Methanocorpusculum sp.]
MKKQDLQIVHEAAALLTEDFRHAEQVCHLSLAIYDDLSLVHGCGKQTRRLLAAAALLHDIGWSVSDVSHHKCGMAFIAEDRTLPFSLRERILVALAVRYHRGPLPKQRHQLYCGLSKQDRRKVQLIAGIIRIADGLDRSHAGVVRSVHAKLSTRTLVISCTGSGRGSPEQRTAAKKADMLMKVFSAGIRICWKRCP